MIRAMMLSALLILTLPASAAETVPPPFSATSCTAIDGDNIVCRGKSYRLSGIDAPELPGHCRAGRDCAPGDPYASQRNLARLISHRRVRVVPLKIDLYRRTVSVAYVGTTNLSCAQLSGGFAVYKPAWDTRRIIRTECNIPQ
jgi:micrococcal nuclease